jgi:hypothetical protein
MLDAGTELYTGLATAGDPAVCIGKVGQLQQIPFAGIQPPDVVQAACEALSLPSLLGLEGRAAPIVFQLMTKLAASVEPGNALVSGRTYRICNLLSGQRELLHTVSRLQPFSVGGIPKGAIMKCFISFTLQYDDTLMTNAG